MNTKLVTRYSCDFCAKRGYSASHMRKHEKGCTKNPNRVCRMCKMVEREQRPIADLLNLLPDPKDYTQHGELVIECPVTGESLIAAVNLCLPDLRKTTGNCPACIMAALRQRGIPVWVASEFHFTDECKEVWTIINDTKDHNEEVRSLYH